MSVLSMRPAPSDSDQPVIDSKMVKQQTDMIFHQALSGL